MRKLPLTKLSTYARRMCLAMAVLAVCVAPASAQELLPSTFAGWSAPETGKHVSAAQVGQFAGDQAPILKEYGLSGADDRSYTEGSGTTRVTLYSMTDPSAAYGAFTFLRQASRETMTPLSLGPAAPYAAGTANRALLVVGNFLLDISSANGRLPDADLKALAANLAPESDRRPFPTIGQFLPPTGLIRGSECYVLGPRALARVFPMAPANKDWFAFGDSAEAIVARYHLKGQPGDHQALLLVVLYPTQQIAAGTYATLTKRFAINGGTGSSDAQPTVYGTRSSSLVALLQGADSREQAVNFLGRIRYNPLVTWDEPTHQLTDPSISTVVVGAIVDTGLIMLIVMAAGLGFGGLRLFIKFMFPGRVFDRNNEVEILQLGLAAKPIESKDFYTLRAPR